jgi:hypothetical protein
MGCAVEGAVIQNSQTHGEKPRSCDKNVAITRDVELFVREVSIEIP